VPKNVRYDKKGLPEYWTKQYDTNIGLIESNYNRGYKYVVWYNTDSQGHSCRETFKNKKDFQKYLDGIEAKYLTAYYQ